MFRWFSFFLLFIVENSGGSLDPELQLELELELEEDGRKREGFLRGEISGHGNKEGTD